MTDESDSIKVGDYVRWECGERWFTGTVIRDEFTTGTKRVPAVAVECDAGTSPYWANREMAPIVPTSRVRRIPRPGEAVAPKISAEGQAAYDVLRKQFSAPPPALIDGLTPAQCLDYYTSNMHEGRGGLHSWHHTTLTPAQLAVAREMWSAAVRAKVAASKDEDGRREVSVHVEVDDL